MGNMSEHAKIAFQNSGEGAGKIFFGLHFYSGLAQYDEPNGDSYKVYLKEDTLRNMDPTFAGKPVFVLHVDEVDPNLDELRKEADGWVVKSFYNESDGKHWVQFVVVSEKGLRAVESGMKLSNCYIAQNFGSGGTWNGIDYDKEITGAEYEHLAIVPNPRYEESVIMTPDEFKKYNEGNFEELKKISNNNDKEGSKKMKFSFFKRTKVENSLDLESMLVVLPKSKREVSIEKLVNEADEHEMKKDSEDGPDKMAEMHHMVDCDGQKMTVNELIEKHKDAMYALSKRKEDAEDHKEEMKDDDGDDSEEMQDAEDPEEDKEAKKKALELAEHEEKEIMEAKRKNARAKALALKNAGPTVFEGAKVVLSDDRLALGRKLY